MNRLDDPRSPTLPLSPSPTLVHGWRFRDRLFPVLTATVAAACVWGAQWVADYVGTMNSARVLGALMTAAIPQQPAPVRSLPNQLFGGMGATPPVTPAQRESSRQMREQLGAVEAIVYVWRRIMWGLAAVLEAVALLSAMTRRVRLWHLLAAAAILLSTAATIVGMRMLVDPRWGGMPELPVRSYVYVAAVQSAYALVLLLAFVKRPLVGVRNSM